MFSSHSVIRRYTPPTCTLEIWAKSSPLSRWAGRTLLKELRFKLNFDDPRLPEEEQVTIEGDRTQLEQLCEAVTSYVQQFLQHSPTTVPLAPEKERSPLKKNYNIAVSTPFIETIGLLSHRLFFGSLANDKSGSTIKLSASQLFDLANALDSYNEEITALPELNPSTNRKVIPIWGASAAAVLLAVGVTAVAIKLNNSSNSETNSVVSLQEPKIKVEKSPKESDVVPPQPPKESTTTPTPKPKVPESLSSAKRLPPPPPVDAPKPLADIPTPPPDVALQIPKPPAPSSSPSTPESQKETTINSQETNVQGDRPNVSSLPAPAPADTDNNKPEAASGSFSSSTASNNRDIPKLPNLPPLQKPESSTPESTPRNPSTEETQITAAASNAETSLNNLPQLSEAKEYFQKRWQPPNGLSQTLEYRIALNTDGSIRRITPIGKASEVYLDRTNMPLMGESFVSPLAVKENPQIRLVLSPDGTVRTFVE